MPHLILHSTYPQVIAQTETICGVILNFKLRHWAFSSPLVSLAHFPIISPQEYLLPSHRPVQSQSHLIYKNTSFVIPSIGQIVAFMLHQIRNGDKLFRFDTRFWFMYVRSWKVQPTLRLQDRILFYSGRFLLYLAGNAKYKVESNGYNSYISR